MSQTALGAAIQPPGWNKQGTYQTMPDDSTWGVREIIATHLCSQEKAPFPQCLISSILLQKLSYTVESYTAKEQPGRIRRMDVPCSKPYCSHCFVWHLGDVATARTANIEQIRVQNEAAAAARKAASPTLGEDGFPDPMPEYLSDKYMVVAYGMAKRLRESGILKPVRTKIKHGIVPEWSWLNTKADLERIKKCIAIVKQQFPLIQLRKCC